MSEKRFFKSHYTEHIIDKANDKCYPIRNVMGVDDLVDLLNSLSEENEQLEQRIKSRLHYYRELCNGFDKDDGFTYNIVKRIVEDLEDILK